MKSELSKRNPYWIEKHRYYELRHFCLQYPIWKSSYNSLYGLSKHIHISDVTNSSKTKNISEITKKADILVAALGKAKFVTKEMVKDGAVVIDVGINKDENGKLCGDIDFEDVKDKVSYITPVPKGVGPATIAMFLENSYKAYLLNNKK